LRDDALYDLAQQKPRSIPALAKLRAIPKGFERNKNVSELIKDINYALDNVEDYAPEIPKTRQMPPNLGPSVEMLRTLLRIKTEYIGIAPRLVANSKDIELIAAFGENANVAALSGWRRDVFGSFALKMLAGELSLRLQDGEVVVEG